MLQYSRALTIENIVYKSLSLIHAKSQKDSYLSNQKSKRN